jgi:hypothetical protein
MDNLDKKKEDNDLEIYHPKITIWCLSTQTFFLVLVNTSVGMCTYMTFVFVHTAFSHSYFPYEHNLINVHNFEDLPKEIRGEQRITLSRSK